jgi:transposase
MAWLYLSRTTGELGPTADAGGQTVVRQMVQDDPDTTLAELCARLAASTGVRVSLATMCRLVQRLA